MKYLNNYLEFSKLYKSEIKNTKTFLLIIANLWLLLIFWKILLVSDASIINNNTSLTKATVLLQPILSILGIDILSPNMLKMMVLTFIVMVTNLSILYFNQMASIIVLTVFARYGHKSYTNYLRNQDNLNYLGFESKKEMTKQAEPSRIIMENTPVAADAANHTHWGVWLMMGLAVVVCFGLLVYSHNSLSDNLVQTNENIKTVNNTLDMKISRINDQVDLNSNSISEQFKNLNDTTKILDQKINQSNNTLQELGGKLIDVDKLANKNILLISQEQVKLSHKASEIMSEASQASTVSEGVTIGLAKIMELFENLDNRVVLTEAKMNSIAEIQTPRRSNINFGNISSNVKTNNET